MRNIKAISYGKPALWGRCFTLVRKAGLCAVGERARVTLAEECGLTWRGLAECFGVTHLKSGRTMYDFEKVGDAEWMKKDSLRPAKAISTRG